MKGGLHELDGEGDPLNEFTVGLVTLDQVITLLKTAKYLAPEVNDLEAKVVDINWKALTGFLYEKRLRRLEGDPP